MMQPDASSVVRITDADGNTLGTGFLVSTDGLIATCAHVVKETSEPHVAFPGSEAQSAQVVSTDDAHDVAFIEPAAPLPGVVAPAEFGPSTRKEGAAVRSFGYPAVGDVVGLWGDGQLVGHVTAGGRSLLQLSSTQITKGFSGGPVWYAATGQVIGMITKFAPLDRYGRLGNVAFAIPAETLSTLCPEEKVTQAPVLPTTVQVYLQGDFPSFSSDRLAAVVDALAGLLGIASQAIQVYDVYRGSIALDLGLPFEAALRLRSFLQSSNAQLRSLEIQKVRFMVEPDVAETWIPCGDEYRLGSEASPAFSHPPTGVPFQAPALPRYFVPRPEVSNELKAQLLVDEATVPGALVVSAVHGLGGIGKTTLVAALAHDPELQKRFPDGVLWTTLGQEAETLSHLQEWTQSLGDYQYHPMTMDGASAHLRTLLHYRACLLVVDDAWQAEHVRPFLVGGDRCRAVVTTRDAGLAGKIGARIYDLDVMTEGQALALFEARLGPLNGNREQAAALARDLGYLPLALELAAAQVEAGISWDELLKTFRQELVDLQARGLDETTYRNESLRLSFRLSLERLSPNDQEAFAWLGVLSEDARINPAVAATLWDHSETDARKQLRRLRDKALLKAIERDHYTIHNLLHDEAWLRLFARPPHGQGLSVQEAHNVLLGRYWVHAQDSLWHTLPDDGYAHEHLAWHMEQAGAPSEIHALLREETPEGRNGWFEACERLAQTATYLADVSRAWDLAFQHDATGLECRYALIAASLNSLAANIPPQLLQALVAHGVWTHSQGLAYARQVPESGQRAWALAALASLLPAAEADVALADAMAAARSMEDEEDHASVLIALAAHLPEPKRGAVFDEALAVIETIKYDPPRARAMVALLPHLPEGLLGKALSAAQDISYEPARAEALSALATRLPEELQGKALKAARRIADDGSKAKALTALAPHMPQAKRGEVLGEALAAARSLDHNMVRILALSALAPHLPEPKRGEVFAEALAAAQQLGYGPSRAAALADLAMHISGEEQVAVWGEALEAAGGTDDELTRAVALATLAPHLPEGLLGKALSAAQDISYGPSRAQALSALATRLPEKLQGKALAAARRIADDGSKAKALTALAPHLPEPKRGEVLGEALAAARAIQNTPNRVLALTALAPHLPEAEMRGALGEALAAVQAIRDDPYRDMALNALAPYLPDAETRAVLDEARSVARGVRYRRARAPSLADQERRTPGEVFTMAPDPGVEGYRLLDLRGWALQLPEAERRAEQEQKLVETLAYGNEGLRAEVLAGAVPYLVDALLDRVLEAARDMKYEAYQVTVLSALVPHLPDSLLGQVLEIARDIAQDGYRAALLVALAPRLPEGLLGEALTVARNTHQELHRAEALAALAPHLPGALQAKALHAAQRIEQEESRADVLYALAPHLPAKLLGEALHAAQKIEQEEPRADVLYALASRLPAELLGDALIATQRIGHADARADVLSALAPQLAACSASGLRSLWRATLSTLATHTRSDLLSDLAALEPVIYALGGQDAIAETVRAIQDVGCWWP